MRLASFISLAVLATAACTRELAVGPGGPVSSPRNVRYTVEASGDPSAPSGILLTWDFDTNPNLRVWHVYSRASTRDAFGLRGSTTSNSFDDRGIPHLEYYVTAEDFDGFESPPSDVVAVDERLALPPSNALTSTTLDGAVALVWSDNPFQSSPEGFSHYRVYGTPFDLDRGVCLDEWALEGTTVAPEFVVGALPNGVPRCFGVSAISIEGWESLWSPVVDDTPRPDAHNIVLYARQVDPAASGFRFWRDANGNGAAERGELGLIESGNGTTIDFSVERDGTGAFSLAPVRAGTGVEFAAAGPVPDLTGIDFAPNQVYRTSPIEALPGWGYIFEMDGGDGFLRYGALRVSHVGQDLIIVDWAFQTDPGNPELLRAGPPSAGVITRR